MEPTLKPEVRDALFLSLWRSLTPAARGTWTEDQLGNGQAFRFRDTDIGVSDGDEDAGFVRAPERDLLLHLVLSCEQAFGVRPLGSTFDEDQIARAIAFEQQDYAELPELIRHICHDMLHGGAQRTVGLTLRRSFLEPAPAERRGEHGHLEASEWLLWLNDNFKGGELFFPTRRAWITPRAGRVVRWPKGIPAGRAAAHEGYSFTLSGRSV